MSEWLGPLPDSNFTIGREGNPITLIVDHWMAGTFASALARFRNPVSIVSAHYLVGSDGRIAQVVRDEDTAYHAGLWSVNLLSVGIEHECSPTMAPTDALYAASARLHRELAQRHGIALEVGATVKPHKVIVPTACPGTLDLDRIVKEAGGTMTPLRVGQSADLTLKPGEVGLLQAFFEYASGPKKVERKVFAQRPGRYIEVVRPPADVDADPTEHLDAEPAIFVVDVTV